MNWRQYVEVALMVARNAPDGFDVLSSAFAAPGIAKEWGVPREALGFGSVLLGGMADKAGRKPTMLACLVIMAIGMSCAYAAGGVSELTIWRFITGIGIGAFAAHDNSPDPDLWLPDALVCGQTLPAQKCMQGV